MPPEASYFLIYIMWEVPEDKKEADEAVETEAGVNCNDLRSFGEVPAVEPVATQTELEEEAGLVGLLNLSVA